MRAPEVVRLLEVEEGEVDVECLKELLHLLLFT
jgi:hypothetical protein